MNAVTEDACKRCGIQKPFYCACEQTVDAQGGLSIFVNNLGVIRANPSESTEPIPAEYFVTLDGRHDFMSTQYRFKPEDAKRLGQLIIAAAEEMLAE